MIFIQKNKLKQNILEKKKVDNKFIINSSSCVYPPNESCDEVDITKKGRNLFKIKYHKNQVVNVNYNFFFLLYRENHVVISFFLIQKFDIYPKK